MKTLTQIRKRIKDNEHLIEMYTDKYYKALSEKDSAGMANYLMKSTAVTIQNRSLNWAIK
jgi:hypothetical protein